MRNRVIQTFFCFSLLVTLVFQGCGGPSGRSAVGPPRGGALTLMSADVLPASVSMPYNFTMKASGGKSPYTWTVSSGSLPAGLSLKSSSGEITGTPTTPGWSNFFTVQVTDSANKTDALSYSMIVNPQLDQYGGLIGHSCTNTGSWHTEKVGTRWWLCDPQGSIFFMQNIGGMFFPDAGCNPSTGQCNNYQTVAKQKYTDLDIHWGPQQNRRLLSWGFNAVGQLSSGPVQPNETGSAWPNGQQPVRLPMVYTLLVSNYAGVNLNSYAVQPTKDLQFGLDSNYNAWRASIMDFYDPNFGNWLDGYFGSSGIQGLLNFPWTIGIFLDDTDWFWGMGAGPDFHSEPPGHTNADPGYMVMITSPVQTFNPNPAQRGVPELYTDTKVYSKTAMTTPPANCDIHTPCSLRNYLFKKYRGKINALNQAWGSNYTTFDSSGTSVSSETIGTGDGQTTVFTHTLSQTPVSPESVMFKAAGIPQAGDCPWFIVGCNISISNMGTLGGPSGTTVAMGDQPWLTNLSWQACNCALPAASYWVQLTYHMKPGYYTTPSRVVGDTKTVPGYQIVVAAPAADPNATGWDIYASRAPIGQNVPPLTLQASNLSFTNSDGRPYRWIETSTGLVAGSSLPFAPSTINYSSGQLQITFSAAPPSGAQIVVDYVFAGWMFGSGLMDEDGRNTGWLGSNPYCLQAATSCDGHDNPLPNANPTVAVDLDGWISQISARYFGTCSSNLRKHAPNILYFGADNVGTWGVPARKEILQGAAPYLDGLFPASDPTQAYVDYTAEYFGDKPLIGEISIAATPDSSLYRYPGASQGLYDFSSQEIRGQRYSAFVQSLLNLKAGPTGSYPYVGLNYWGLIDFWNEKIDWGLVSLNDNPYDGKSATITIRRDAWGFATGAEEKNYGDAIDYVRQGNARWYSIP